MTSDQPQKAQAKQTWYKQDEIFRLLVNGVHDYAIFMLDSQGQVMTWNEGAQRIKGYKADEIIGKHFSEFYTQEARDIKHPDNELKIARKKGSYEEEGWRVRKDGSTFWANVLITAIYEGEKLVGFAKVTRDLTERRQANQQRDADARVLAQTNQDLQRALDMKSKFLSTISHEVRTPMSGIIGLAEILTLKDLGKENNELVRSIFDSSNQLLQLLNDLLDTARMDSGKLTLEYRMFPIRALLGDVRQLIKPEAMKKNLNVGGSCPSAVPDQLCGDEFRLRQVLLNLAFNAAKFTEHGEISVNCEVKEKEDDKTILRFSVSDTGIGIAPENQEKLFHPFEQGQRSTSRLYGGSGLGLSIAKSLVELMGGQIGVDSTEGKGSTFWFDLPFSDNKCEIPA